MKLLLDYERATPAQSLAADVGLLLARLPLGVLFVYAGWHKVTGGVGNFVASAAKSIPPFLPESLGRAYLWAVPWAELTVGVCLLLGLMTRVIGAIATLMVISFTIAVTGFKAGPPGGPFNTNIFYIALAASIALLGPGRISIDGPIASRRRTP